MEKINQNNIEIEKEEIGGMAACVIGCASFCLIGAGAVNAMASVATIA